MSTVFLGFRAKNDNNLNEQIGVIKFIAKINNLVRYLEREGAEVQVFRTSTGIVYRVLEQGYGLKNKMWAHEDFFPQCAFDGRSMTRDEVDPKDLRTIDEIDHLIKQRANYIIEIVKKETNENE